MDRRTFIAVVSGGLLVAPLAAGAQRAGKVYRVGYLGLTARRDALADSLLRALRDLGYVEGQNLLMEFRCAAGNAARLPDLADELARARVDVIMAFSHPGRQGRQAGHRDHPYCIRGRESRDEWDRGQPCAARRQRDWSGASGDRRSEGIPRQLARRPTP